MSEYQTQHTVLKRIQMKYLISILILFLLAANCAAASGITVRRGDPAIRDLPFTGISGLCVDEQTARDEAMRNGLAQISLFDGVSVDYTYITNLLEENGNVSDKAESKLSMISKSLVRAIKFEYYIEQTKSSKGKTWQAWCHIPYSDTIRQKFLDELIRLSSNAIEPAEVMVYKSQQTDAEDYIDSIERSYLYYRDEQVIAKGWFTAPNDYTVFLENKRIEHMQRAEAFYRTLELTSIPMGENKFSMSCSYNEMPYLGKITVIEKNATPLIDSLVVTKVNDSFLVSISPKHSGSTTVRVTVDQDRFPGVQCYLDVSLPVQLQHIFSGKTIGLNCRDSKGKRLETATVFGKLITDYEGKVVDLSMLDADNALIQAKKNGCSYLFIAETGLTEVRENTQQKLFIAFPTLSLKIMDVSAQKVIYQSQYPNATMPDIRGLGKTREAAISKAYSFGAVLIDQAFNRGFREINSVK